MVLLSRKRRFTVDELRMPGDTTIRVHDSTADMRYLVLPMRPAGTEGFDEARLAALVTRDAMVGVTQGCN
jgi:nitrile hydratase